MLLNDEEQLVVDIVKCLQDNDKCERVKTIERLRVYNFGKQMHIIFQAFDEYDKQQSS